MDETNFKGHYDIARSTQKILQDYKSLQERGHRPLQLTGISSDCKGTMEQSWEGFFLNPLTIISLDYPWVMGRDLSWRVLLSLRSQISSKQDIIAILGMDELSEEDKLTVARARKVGCKKTKRDEWYLPVEWQVKWNHICLENVTYYLYCNIYSVYSILCISVLA